MRKRFIAKILIFVFIVLLLTSNVFASPSILRVGSRGSAVKNLQTKLNELGYNAGAADGIFGSKTKAAVMAFQRANGLVVDGIAGPATFAKLNGTEAPATTKPDTSTSQPSSSAPVTSTLRQGSRSNQVKTLQTKLNSLGYNSGTADGIFGRNTRNAVVAFQRANGLVADGIVGRLTISKLYPAGSTSTDPKPSEPEPSDPKPSEPVKAPITSTLRQGSRGEQVRTLQNKLNSLGYNSGKADGIFGANTRKAVIAFQRANALAVDGIVGPATISKLYPPIVEPKPEEPKPEEPKPEPEDNKPSVTLYKPQAGSLKGKTIIVDAGHGGKDSGAVWNGNYEKTYNLDMAKRLERILKEAGANVIMTRTDDSYSYLFSRSAFVNRYIVDRELESLKKELEALEANKGDNSESKVELEELKARKGKLEIEIGGLEDSLAEYSKELEELKSLEELEGELHTLISQLEGLIDSDKEHSITNIEELLVKAKEYLAGLGEASDEPEDDENTNELQDEESSDEIDGKKKDVEEAIVNLETKKDEYDNSKKELDSKIDELNTKIENLNKDISTKNKELENLQNEISELESSLSSSTDIDKEIQKKKDEISELERKGKLLDDIIKNPNLQNRTGIYTPSKVEGRLQTINKDLGSILDLTKEYGNNTIFVSVHCNASGKVGADTVSGVQVYYRDSNSDPNDRVNLNYYTNYDDAKRLKLAQSMLNHTRDNTNFKGQWSRPFKKDFHVLREQNLPSVLMEVGFVNNPDDVKLLNMEQTREDAAKGMYLGIVEFFK